MSYEFQLIGKDNCFTLILKQNKKIRLLRSGLALMSQLPSLSGTTTMTTTARVTTKINTFLDVCGFRDARREMSNRISLVAMLNT